jgi:trehalose 6-phosphate phosphatase
VNTSDSASNLFKLVCQSPPAGVLTDIDGTISEIVAHPEWATVSEETRVALSSLTSQFALVGAVSGRSAEDARNLVGLDGLVYSGNHGMEIWRNGRLEQSPLAARYSPHIEELLSELTITRRVPGLFVENKGLTASIHFRTTSDPAVLEQELLDEVYGLAKKHGLRITQGRMVVEIRPPVELSKGTSVLEIIDEYQLEGLVYLGDDVTDIDAFKALRQRRLETGKPYVAIGVESSGTPEDVINTSDATVNGVEGVVALLRSCA